MSGLKAEAEIMGRLTLQILPSSLTIPTGICSLPCARQHIRSMQINLSSPSQRIVDGGQVVTSRPT
jgi:hypothetical protein